MVSKRQRLKAKHKAIDCFGNLLDFIV